MCSLWRSRLRELVWTSYHFLDPWLINSFNKFLLYTMCQVVCLGGWNKNYPWLHRFFNLDWAGWGERDRERKQVSKPTDETITSYDKCCKDNNRDTKIKNNWAKRVCVWPKIVTLNRRPDPRPKGWENVSHVTSGESTFWTEGASCMKISK